MSLALPPAAGRTPGPLGLTRAGSAARARRLCLGPGRSPAARAAALLLSAAALVAACSDEAPAVEVALVQIDPESLELEVGSAATLAVHAFDEAGRKVQAGPVRWTSSDPSTASIDAKGISTGVAAGEATITAAIGGRSGSASVRVIPARVATVEILPAAARLFPEDTLQLAATALSSRGTSLENRAAAWSSDAPEIASVSGDGLVRARKPGLAEITAVVDEVAAGILVVVVPRVSAIRLEPERLVLFEGETGSFTATVIGSNGEVLDDREIEWSSGDPEVASLGEGGVVRAGRPGEAAVYAEAEEVVGMAMVEVRARPASVRIEPPALLLQVGTSWGLSAIVTDTVGGEHPGEGCVWSSTAPEVIRIFEDGSVHSLAEGQGELEVRCEGHRASIEATVIPRAELRILGPDRVVVGEEPIRLEASMEGRPPAGPLRWAWGPLDRIDVDDGRVTGLLPGRPWVFASAEGRTRGREILSVMRFDELFAGPWDTCGRIRDGRVFCWGDTRMYFWAQSGSFPTPVPQPVVEPRRGEDFEIEKISLGETMGAALLADVQGFAQWGCFENCYQETRGSELGLISPDWRIVEVSAGYAIHRIRPPPQQPLVFVNLWCALTADGQVNCAGPGTQTNSDILPFEIELIETRQFRIPFSAGAFDGGGFANTDQRFVDVRVSVASACALTAEGEVWCWGPGGIDGMNGLEFDLGSGSAVPAPLAGAPPVRSISAGKYHTCGLTSAGAAWCWGHSREGALGAGFAGSSELPVEVAGGHAFLHISASIEHTCGLTIDGEIWCWGRGDPEPVQVPLEGTIRQVVAGARHGCALRDDGVALCWGDNGRFQAGDDVAEVAWPPRPVYPENR